MPKYDDAHQEPHKCVVVADIFAVYPRSLVLVCNGINLDIHITAMQLYEYYLNWIIHNLPYYLWHQYSIHAFGISISYINDNTMLINTV